MNKLLGVVLPMKIHTGYSDGGRLMVSLRFTAEAAKACGKLFDIENQVTYND